MGKKGNKKNGWGIKATVVVFSVLSIISVACRQAATPTAAPTDQAAYKSELQKWQNDRLAGLTKDDGWLTLIGLFWLNDGDNKLGSDPKNAIVLPQAKAPGYAGTISRTEAGIYLTPGPNPGMSVVTPQGEPEKQVAKLPTKFKLKSDTDDGGPTIIKLGSLRMNLIKRGDRFGLRVKDTESQTRREFKGLEYYPIDPKWRIEARFEPYQPPKTIPITNVLSMTDDETSPGALAFEVDGKTYRLDPILEEGETDWFIMIADDTTGKETYGAGRYLYVTPADASGKVVIDFNKAYSPPCAFTNFATCPLPPRQNHLPLRIDAGEKKYAGTVH